METLLGALLVGAIGGAAIGAASVVLEKGLGVVVEGLEWLEEHAIKPFWKELNSGIQDSPRRSEEERPQN